MAGTWQALSHQPTFSASTMLLLTDGSVMCQDGSTKDWWKLVPDQFGSYVNGTWSKLASMKNTRDYYASAVLRDGRVFIGGGERSDAGGDTNKCEIYDPVANNWTSISSPTGWPTVGDAPCCVLPDGRVLLGHLSSNKTAIYDPVANTWTAAGNKNNASSSEETWALLPDETVLTCDCNGHPQAEKYIIAADRWMVIDSTPSDLVEASSIEIGPFLLLPDGRLFAIGATGHTALYTPPPVANQKGSWTDGPTFPTQGGQQLIAKDAPGCLLPNGKVLCVVSPAGGCSASWQGYCPPTYFYEFDPANSSLTSITNPPNNGGATYEGRMLLLPTGQVLFSNNSTDVEVYTPDGSPDPAWRPQITNSPASVQPGHTYTIRGRQLNGLSQAVSYGDDAMMATNYPIVRIRNTATGHVYYCRTRDHSTMGLQTGTVIHSTRLTVPGTIELGSSELCVIANGIASSSCVPIVVNHKIWKELKWEIKENIKQEIDLVNTKIQVEVKGKEEVEGGIKLTVEGDPWKKLIQENPELVRIIGLLAQRSDEVEEARVTQQGHFISKEERPILGAQKEQEEGNPTTAKKEKRPASP